MNKLITLLAALLLAAPLGAKELQMPDKAGLGAPAFTVITGSPLQINVGADNSYQIFNLTLPPRPGGGLSGQIYPSSAQQTADMGWFVRVGNTLYHADFDNHPGGNAVPFSGNPFIETSLSPLTGTGTQANPYNVSVVVNLGTSGLRAIKTTSYVNGNNYFTERFRLVNTTGSAVQASIYLGSDIFLANSDAGTPFREPTSGSPGGRTCAGVTPPYTILHIPLTPATRFTADQYAAVWSQISSGTLSNQVLQNPCVDNGAALQWDVNVQPLGSRTVLAATSFGDVPDITQFNIIEVNPGQGVIGTTVQVVISGYGFLPGTTFNFGAGITVSDLVIVNSTTARATLTIASDATLGFRDVVATQTPGGIVATLVDGFVVTDPPVWNYGLHPSANVSEDVFACVAEAFPGDPARNAPGWAPDEGLWSSELPPGVPGPPVGLARAILDCFLHPFVWDSTVGTLTPAYCWLSPFPRYDGDYPGSRAAGLRLYDAVNGVCEGQQPGWPIYKASVLLTRIEFFPIPMARSGFEEL